MGVIMTKKNFQSADSLNSSWVLNSSSGLVRLVYPKQYGKTTGENAATGKSYVVTKKVYKAQGRIYTILKS